MMKPSESLTANREAIKHIVFSHKAINPRVFGSVLHGTDTEASDLDILVDPTPATTLFDMAAIQSDLKKLLGIRVQVVTPNSLPESFREKVLSEAQTI